MTGTLAEQVQDEEVALLSAIADECERVTFIETSSKTAKVLYGLRTGSHGLEAVYCEVSLTEIVPDQYWIDECGVVYRYSAELNMPVYIDVESGVNDVEELRQFLAGLQSITS